jgi:hypothetical protein
MHKGGDDNMKRNKFALLVCLVALLGVTSCSDDDDDVINLPVTAQAEAAIEGVFNEVIDPLSEFVEAAIAVITAAQPKAPALECPNMAGVCTSGDATCDVDSSGTSLDFNFDECNVAEAGVVVDGSVSVAPSGPTSFLMNLVGLSIDGSDPLSGSIEIDLTSCGQQWFIDAGSSIVLATVSVDSCDDDYPNNQSALQMTVFAGNDVWVFTFNFTGTSTSSVFGTRNEEPVTQCTFDLDTYQADCSEFGDL